MSETGITVNMTAARARAAMQEAFKSDVQEDLTRGTFEPTAQFSKVEHVRTIEEEKPTRREDARLLASLVGTDEDRIDSFIERLLSTEVNA